MREIYVLQVMSGMELAVEEKLKHEGLTGTIIPMEERLERFRGDWITRKRLLMPGYVFVYIDMNTKEYYKAWNIPGVIRFLGAGRPSALSEDEKMQIFWLYGDGGLFKPSTIRGKPGGQIEVTDGPLVGHEKDIVKLDRHRKKAKVRMTFSGEPIELTVSAYFV
ncbi:Uncharacterised protein [Eubacterium limosum]|uniref:NusG-like N-terminal domain-containing protein n=1 Tax=Eubacterium limosum TaxID=1736 RepID=A0A6N3FQX2_EUBLI